MIRFIIPARKGSKGFPQKNQKLFDYTANTIPDRYKDRVYVTSNDVYILEKAKRKGFNCFVRNEKLSSDIAHMKEVLLDFICFDEEDILVLLYLTYPERTWEDVEKAIDFFEENNAKSMLCRKEWKYSHPALCMFTKENIKGEQVFAHNFYRRQCYPEVFEISHYVFICRVGEIKNLKLNLYNEDTIYFPIKDTIDIDTVEDFNIFLKKINRKVHNEQEKRISYIIK